MTDATINIEDVSGNMKIAHMQGQLDESNIDEKIKEIYANIEKVPKGLQLIFDFSSLDYMNSKSIGYLTDIYGKVTEGGGRVIIAGAKPNIADILQVVGLTQIIENVATLEEAKKKMETAASPAPAVTSAAPAPVAVTPAPAPAPVEVAPQPVAEPVPAPAPTPVEVAPQPVAAPAPATVTVTPSPAPVPAPAPTVTQPVIEPATPAPATPPPAPPTAPAPSTEASPTAPTVTPPPAPSNDEGSYTFEKQ